MSPLRVLSDRGVDALRLELSVQRSLRRLTYDGLAAISGVSRRTLISIETGASNGSLESWMKICRALNCDFSKFVEMSEDVPDASMER